MDNNKITLVKSPLLHTLQARLLLHGTQESVTPRQLYRVSATLVREELEKRYAHRRAQEKRNGICYVVSSCYEEEGLFWHHARRLSMADGLKEAFAAFGYSAEQVTLSGGGMYREPSRAESVLDSMLEKGSDCLLYTLCCEERLYRKTLQDGAVVSFPVRWLKDAFFMTPLAEESMQVRFGGHIAEHFRHLAPMQVEYIDSHTVAAIPYRSLWPGRDGEGIAAHVAFRAGNTAPLPRHCSSQGEYWQALQAKERVQHITRHAEEGEMHLEQAYFLASAAVQDMMKRTRSMGEAFLILCDGPSLLAIPEWMRWLLDRCGMPWNEAMEVLRRQVRCLLFPLRAEPIRAELFRLTLPRLYAIVAEWDRRHATRQPLIVDRMVDLQPLAELFP